MEQVFSQSEVEVIAVALADTSAGLSGSEIGHILSLLRMKDPDPTMTKWKRLHNAFVERQNKSGNRESDTGICSTSHETRAVRETACAV